MPSPPWIEPAEISLVDVPRVARQFAGPRAITWESAAANQPRTDQGVATVVRSLGVLQEWSVCM